MGAGPHMVPMAALWSSSDFLADANLFLMCWEKDSLRSRVIPRYLTVSLYSIFMLLIWILYSLLWGHVLSRHVTGYQLSHIYYILEHITQITVNIDAVASRSE